MLSHLLRLTESVDKSLLFRLPYGGRSLTLDLGLRRTFRWIVIADVAMPIRGADFLRHFGLIVDMGRHRLSDSSTNLEVKGRTVDQPALCLTLLPLSQNSFQAILKEYPAVLQTSPQQPVKHTVTHHIQTTGPPTHSATRRLSPAKLNIAKNEFEHMLQLGIIRPSPHGTKEIW